jgi:hypothetical protein
MIAFWNRQQASLFAWDRVVIIVTVDIPVFGPPRGENLSGSCGISNILTFDPPGLKRFSFQPL